MENILSKTEPDDRSTIISDRAYNIILGAVTFYGIAVNWLMVRFIPPNWVLQFGRLPLLVCFFVFGLTGIFLYTRSRNPVMSFAGYNLVIVPTGLGINAVVSGLASSVVLLALQVTGIVTVAMILAGILFPPVLKRFSRVLILAVDFAVLALILFMFVTGKRSGVADWLVSVILCCYIVFNWSWAQSAPRTVNNAIDSAAALYFNIILVFLRVLRHLRKQN